VETVDKIISDRRAAIERGDGVPNDILQVMLTTPDKVTGRRLPDDNIRAQLITFLLGGHETTSGLLSYALHAVATHPEVEHKLVAEVEAVLGRDYRHRPTYADLEKLDYTLRVLKETLRLNPPTPGFGRTVARDTVVAGKYAVPAGSTIVTFLPALHRNPRFWGEHPEIFDPDRFLIDAIAARHPDAYHPFGMGMRSCIGSEFALLTAKMVMARLYQRFLPRLADKEYKLAHIQTLAVKPKDLNMVVLPLHPDRSP
jgi:cytochrome P450/NADPH-cytochrome P450 reductase